MNDGGFIALAALILLLLPAVVLPWEGRRAPGLLYVAIGVAGLIAAGMRGGFSAVAWALAGAPVALVVVAAIATAIRLRHRVHVVTAGHVKLMTAGSLWLGPAGALAMVAAAFALLIIAALLQQRRARTRRPDFMAIAAIAILCAGIQQSLPDRSAGAAAAANLGP